VKRPAMTTKQRQYAREQRALLRLRRAAVRFSEWDASSVDSFEERRADLEAACDAYNAMLTSRDRRRLLK
jgi:hypothetical protein